MKKLLFVLILISSVHRSNGQNYHPMLSDSCTWYISSCFEGCTTQTSYIEGDTVINGNYYYKYFIQDWDKVHHLGCIREDTLNQKIIFKGLTCCFGSDTSEFIVFNFNLVQGDSVFLRVPIIVCWGCNGDYGGGIDSLGWYTIDSISTFETLIGNRKIIYSSKDLEYGKDYVNWVEGFGFVYQSYWPYITPGSYWLNCFFRRGIKEYSWNPLYMDIECNYYSSGIKESKLKDDDILIIYERIPENIKIEKLAPSTFERMEIKIFDNCGHLVKQNSTNLEVTYINISNLNNGIYLVSVVSKDKIVTTRIIK